MKIKVTRNYQITIPVEIRRKLDLRIGDILDVTYDNERDIILIKKVKQNRRTLKAGRKLAPEEIEVLIRKGIEDNL